MHSQSWLPRRSLSKGLGTGPVRKVHPWAFASLPLRHQGLSMSYHYYHAHQDRIYTLALQPYWHGTADPILDGLFDPSEIALEVLRSIQNGRLENVCFQLVDSQTSKLWHCWIPACYLHCQASMAHWFKLHVATLTSRLALRCVDRMSHFHNFQVHLLQVNKISPTSVKWTLGWST